MKGTTHATDTGATAVEMTGITKHFGQFRANENVNFNVKFGEIHALLGENGAGKSTLMNMLYGLLTPDEGIIRVAGTDVRFESPVDARAAGIGMVHQHYMLVPTLTALENIILGDIEQTILSRSFMAELRRKVEKLEEKYGLEINKDVPIWQLSVGEQQRVEILRALYHNSRILILDEPTAMLTPNEIKQLLVKLKAMAKQGNAIIMITHHLDEVMEVADRITILRHGVNAATLSHSEAAIEKLAWLMIGEDKTDLIEVATEHNAVVADGRSHEPITTKPVLTVSRLSVRGSHGEHVLDNISFDVRRGEVVGVIGVSGNGQNELEEALFGLRPSLSGHVILDGHNLDDALPSARARHGMGLIPSDRYQFGMIKAFSIEENLAMDRIDQPPFGSRYRFDRAAIASNANDLITKFDIRTRGRRQLAGDLSGGNTQRIVLARELSKNVKLLIASQPARGLDIHAVAFVREELRMAADRSVGVLLISTELEEVLALADRVHVIYRGAFVGSWERSEFSREKIGLAMGGVNPTQSQFKAEII